MEAFAGSAGIQEPLRPSLDFVQLLPQLAGALSSEQWESGTGHNHRARHASLLAYNK